ncbi:MAG: tryptophan synthase subunit alpha [Candidatus Omnitrophica bacterium]|nr:tryptophan synthase subunit alpha [Candidatus Omnitrophota bacterium]
MNRIEETFKQLRSQGRKALIIFVTAGYPSLDFTEKLIQEMSKLGVDVFELGIPFSDPIADGPIIQESSYQALLKGTTLRKVLKLTKRLRSKIQTPICFMTYYNPVFVFGIENFLRQAVVSGVDGLIIPDLPYEEAKYIRDAAKKYQIKIISFIAPTTDLRRCKEICSTAEGFIYYISITGTTGMSHISKAQVACHIQQIKRLTHVPVCVGFGISDPEQAKKLSQVADGVIVGSAIIKKIKENINSKNCLEKVLNFVKLLRKSV